jgi:hypothetical protein
VHFSFRGPCGPGPSWLRGQFSALRDLSAKIQLRSREKAEVAMTLAGDKTAVTPDAPTKKP